MPSVEIFCNGTYSTERELLKNLTTNVGRQQSVFDTDSYYHKRK
jgi:hypothetical protein